MLISCTSSRTSATAGRRFSGTRDSNMPVPNCNRPIGEPSSCATSPRNLRCPLTNESNRAPIWSILSPNRPISSARTIRTRVSNLPSAIDSVARIIFPKARVIPNTSGSHHKMETTNAITTAQITGFTSNRVPKANDESETATNTPGRGIPPGSTEIGIRTAAHQRDGFPPRSKNRLPAAFGSRAGRSSRGGGRSSRIGGGGPSPSSGPRRSSGPSLMGGGRSGPCPPSREGSRRSRISRGKFDT